MTKEYKINKKTSVDEIRKLAYQGYSLICPYCDNQLFVAFTLEDANKLGVIPGVYCHNNPSHFYLHINLDESRINWDKYKHKKDQ